MSLPDPLNSGLDIAELAKRSPGAVGAMVACMEANAEHTASMETLVRASIERDRDVWRERALEAEAQLDRVEQRILALLR